MEITFEYIVYEYLYRLTGFFFENGCSTIFMENTVTALFRGMCVINL